MAVRVVSGPEILTAVTAALSGGDPVIPVPPGGPDAAAALAGPEPLEHPDTAVLVATSGSTGRPKGVLLTRSALLASARATQEALGGPGAWVCPLPLHYVAGLMTVVRAWVASRPVSVVGAGLDELPIVAGERNYLSVVAAQLHRALDDPAALARLAAFDAILVGGSAVPADLLDLGRARGLRLVATYGMTETCGGCVYDGVPLPGVEVAVDHAERIWIGGPQLFAGYRGDADATAAALVGGRLRTQDRGAWDRDRLLVMGRLDEVVISGGVNVDLAAAQRAADAAFGPGEVLLLALPDDRFGARIVAVTARSWSLEQVRGRLQADLTPTALPRDLRRVPTLPLTGTGKVDRRRLVNDWIEGSRQ